MQAGKSMLLPMLHPGSGRPLNLILAFCERERVETPYSTAMRNPTGSPAAALASAEQGAKSFGASTALVMTLEGNGI